MERLTTPSFYWALWVVLLNKKWRNVVLVFVKPWRFLYAWLYLSQEGYFKSGDTLIAQDFLEPHGLAEFLSSLATGEWLKVETQPLGRVENFEYNGGFLYTEFRAVGIGNAQMPRIAVGDSVKVLHERFDEVVERNRSARTMDGVVDEARRQLAIEREKERLRREQDAS